MHTHIIACARSYLGTRFHHQGRLKKTANHKGGIDCLGLLVGIASELDLRDKHGEKLSELDRIDYSHQPDTLALKAKLAKALYPVRHCERSAAIHLSFNPKDGSHRPHGLAMTELQPADILLLTIDGRAQHLALVSDLGIIHAYAPARCVVEHALDESWIRKIDAIYELPEIFPGPRYAAPEECRLARPD